MANTKFANCSHNHNSTGGTDIALRSVHLLKVGQHYYAFIVGEKGTKSKARQLSRSHLYFTFLLDGTQRFPSLFYFYHNLVMKVQMGACYRSKISKEVFTEEWRFEPGSRRSKPNTLITTSHYLSWWLYGKGHYFSVTIYYPLSWCYGCAPPWDPCETHKLCAFKRQ